MAVARPSRTSLSTRIFLAFAVVVATSGFATFYAVAAVTNLRHELGFLRQRALPLLEELRQSETALRGFDEALQRAAPHDLEWVVRFVPNARPYQRIDQILVHTRGLRDFSTPPSLARLLSRVPLPLPVLDSSLVALRSAHEARDRMVQDPELLAATGGIGDAKTDAAAFDVLVAGLQRAIAEKRLSDASRIVVEIRRTIRHVHGALSRAEHDFERVLNARFEEAERAEANLQVLVVTASLVALGVSVVMLLAMLTTLRPMTVLTEVVRRFAAGDRKVRAATGGANEIATLALEWNRMADALALREAQLSGQREDLARAERLAALGHMAARMAHEVRNPLSSIGLNAELLDEEVGRGGQMDQTEAHELIAAIGAEIERLRGITEGYLARARPSSAEHAVVQLDELVSSLLDFVRTELERRGVQATLHVQPVSLQGDPDLLRQALWNLVRNAWEAMPEGGHLWVEAYPQGTEAVLAVEDSGPGVPEAQKESIFQPFTTTKPSGTGIGLALAREAAHAHRGKIALVPGVHGTGARFELAVPAAE
jgi:two-component system NtrC family sensor kinase